jgi:uncharacterized membrane protein YdjX (TVP38/TMEM64 family)
MSKRTKKIAKLTIILILIYFALRLFLLPIITSSEFREFTRNLGVYGYFVVIGYVVLSHVFAPLTGTPGVVLGVTIYGINTGMWLLYFGGLISSTINFYIAQRFGRKWVTKLTGKSSIKKIDEFASVEGKEVLIISRLFGFALFDFISYAAGLTTIKFKDYFIITAVASLIVNLIVQLAFRSIDFQSEFGIMIWIGSIVVAGITFGLLINHYLKRKRKKPV